MLILYSWKYTLSLRECGEKENGDQCGDAGKGEGGSLEGADRANLGSPHAFTLLLAHFQ